ncbi:receptor-like protein 7 [Telopea speciosissima]|uniref:receptor-like protein 7 n=1 Tax=Telopea speciosissima TaxID=54955 RepID=UPI001CC5951E|nr:receptor-like protein 7 [Telopea speciosissima]
MRSPQISWLLLLYSVSVLFSIDEVLVCGQCLEDQRSLLLKLNQSLSFYPRLRSVASKLATWNTSTDCCRWRGVSCDKDSGHVNVLDLSSEYISGGINNSSSSLFKLRHLQSLNLANNYFNSTIPFGFGKFVNLTNLNLSNAGFAGQVPIEISRLTRLVSLDLSATSFGLTLLRLEKPDLRTLVRNLSGLRTLRLDGVNISAYGSQWCQALSSALPNLQVLSLSNCYLLGPLDSSLAKLSFLSQIRLSQNNISEVPIFLGDFRNLTSLHLSSCGLHGTFPDRILQLRTLRTLDVSLNPRLHGFLPEFPPKGGSLQTLVLSTTSFSGSLPESISHLSLLSKLELKSCSFNGSIPSSIIELKQLDSLDLSLNSFTGLIPPLPETLTLVNLAHNYLTGPITDSPWERFANLVNLDLRNNSLNGTIPWSLFTLPTLKKLQLNQNQFAGQIMEIHNMSSAPLDTLDLSSNNLEGPIPLSIFELQNLSVLALSSNNFNGTIELEMFQKLQNLTSLDLSYNNLLVNIAVRNSDSSFPQIRKLILASCKLRGFPDFLSRNQSIMSNLDLSNNQIQGKIPTWVWKIGDGSLTYLNLSFNFLDSLERPLPDLSNSALSVLDLHSNLLQGPIPVLSSTLTYLDFSNNSFQSIIPSTITPSLVFTIFFSLSSNNLTGEIPQSICNAGYLRVLDLSNNSLNGTIPSCLADMSATLTVLNLRHNNFVGHIPQEFPVGCTLRTLDLSGNRLEGPLPSALTECIKLEVLNLGNNQINGPFPFCLGSCTDLRVLVLRSNRFSGPIEGGGTNYTFPKLQIVDLSSNNFTGNFPTESFMTWKAMMVDEDVKQSEIKHETLRVRFLKYSQVYYQDTVTVTIKGQEMELTKILTVYTSIDLSNNGFQGEIPNVIGNLTALYFLNLSHNALTGRIPSSLGNLKQLESLDLSSNKLIGEIPQQLTNLTFLSVLNLSWNNFSGMIPKGSQFQTFTETSFEGNEGLCGAPLSRNAQAMFHRQHPDLETWVHNLMNLIGSSYLVEWVLVEELQWLLHH